MAIRMTKSGPQSYEPKSKLIPSKSYIEEEPKQPTPQPTPEQRRNDAAEYIRDREKLASMAGVSSKMAAYSMIGGQQKITEQNLLDQKARAIAAQNAPLVGNIDQAQGGQATNTFGSVVEGAAPDIVTGGLGGAAAGIGTGAAIGAGVGSVVPVVGTAAGAIIGGVIGGIVGVSAGIVSKLQEEEKQNVKVAYTNYVQSSTNLKSIINMVNAGQISGVDAVRLYNMEIQKIDNAEADLTLASKPARDWLSNSKDELVKIETFNSLERPIYNSLLEQAMLNPNPSKIMAISALNAEE